MGLSGLRLWAYGLVALPLAFVALPLYVQWPAYAVAQWGLPLETLGLLMLGVRLVDALVDPWLGRMTDGWFSRSWSLAWWALGLAVLAVSLGFVGLVLPPQRIAAQPVALQAWLVGALTVVSLGYGTAQVLHQSWAARLGGTALEQARLIGTREGLAVLGVLLACALPVLLGWLAMVLMLPVLLALSWLVLRLSRDWIPGAKLVADVAPGRLDARPALAASAAQCVGLPAPAAPLESPWRDARFRRLALVQCCNGLASAWPAALVVWFIRDALQASAQVEAGLLAAYFCAAALSMPLWVRAVAAVGPVRAWLLGMGLGVLSFVGTVMLGVGDAGLFALICAVSGISLGADLVISPALLTLTLHRRHAPGRAEGRWLGWWALLSKLTLALAAGLALPWVQAAGFTPGLRDGAALRALTWSYALVPCGLKLLAALCLWRSANLLHPSEGISS